MRQLWDRMLSAPDEIDQLNLPPRFMEARDRIRAAISCVERTGIDDETLLAVLVSETLPRMVHLRGPATTALILARLARDIGSGLAPNCTQQ